MRGGEPDVQGIRLRALRRVCGLDIVDADKANLLGRYAIQAQRNIDIARRQNACRGAN